VAVTNELTAHGEFESFVLWEEAGALEVPLKFYFVCELCEGVGGVSAMVGDICSIALSCGEEVAMFGGVVEGSYWGGETEFACICFEIGVD
jgi:hypothetical protein